jgi:hypothetical protein
MDVMEREKSLLSTENQFYEENFQTIPENKKLVNIVKSAITAMLFEAVSVRNVFNLLFHGVSSQSKWRHYLKSIFHCL